MNSATSACARTASLILIALVLVTHPGRSAGQGRERPVGVPVLWRAPDDILARDLYQGPGGEQMRPDLRRVTFIKQETGGRGSSC